MTRQFTPEERPASAVFISEKLGHAAPPHMPAAAGRTGSIVIVGGGAADNAAAETLRNKGYSGSITMLSANGSLLCDRPNLSKSYLAGTASDAFNFLRSARFYCEDNIDVQLGACITAIDVRGGHVALANGTQHARDALLLTTGAEPIRLKVPGSDLPHVHTLRTLADSRALASKAVTSRRAVVIGASFIGLEAAAALSARHVDVHVVGLETIPIEKLLGPDVDRFIRKLHEDHGVTFHLSTAAISIDAHGETLQNSEILLADLVITGIGVRPNISLAQSAGLAVDRGVTVNEYLETSILKVFAAGDIARWPDRLTGERIRVEHFVVAERQGQTAARNTLGHREVYDAVPFL